MHEKPQRFLKVKQVMERIPLSRTTIWRMVEEGTFPTPKKIGRSTVWLESEIDDFIEKISEKI